jgi:hypothetical protein
MTPKQYNDKYQKADETRREDFWVALKTWLEANPEKFIVCRTYIPGFMDGDPCLPTIDLVGAGPGYIDDYYVASDGSVSYIDDLEPEFLPEWDQKFLEATKDLDGKERVETQDHELSATLIDGYEDNIGEWDVLLVMKLVTDKRRKNYGEVVWESEDYECGF